jgi:elongation factor P
MPTISSNDFKNGITIVVDGQLWDIVEFQFVKPGKGTPFIRTKLRNLKTGQVLEPTFDAKQPVEQAILDKVEWEYLYRDGEHYVFMDTTTFDQHHVDKKKVEPLLDFLTENTKCAAKVYDGELITLALPDFMEFDVIEAEPFVKGQQAAGGNKPARIQTGAKIMVPQFVVAGTRIKVDTRDHRYVDRV